MVYMTVEEHSLNLLHLKRSPGIRSWSLLVGIASVGFAAAYYSSDSIFWKLFYMTGCLFVAMQNMEEWEEAVFDKTKNLIELKSFSLYAFFLTLWRKGHEKVVLDLRQLCDICVQEERVRYLGKGYLLMLRLAAGFSYPLTQSATPVHLILLFLMSVCMQPSQPMEWKNCFSEGSSLASFNRFSHNCLLP
uniref:Essential for reactive oxygen species protein n=1 Tax=Takifugu rubripes TaxID=31033 RepID=A0A674NVT7_TAKRU